MENTERIFKLNSGRSLVPKINGFTALLLTLAITFFPACVEKKMTVKEAKEVTISIGGKLYEPPPRRLDEILSILEQPGKFDPELAEKARLEVDARPPATDSAAELAEFYYNRGFAALNYGRHKQGLADFQTAAKYAQNDGVPKFLHAKIMWRLAEMESYFGNYKQAIIFIKESLRIEELVRSYHTLARLHFISGDLQSGKEAAEAGIALGYKIAKRSKKANPWMPYWQAHLRALLNEEQGNYKAAESHHRAMIQFEYDLQSQYVGLYLKGKFRLIMNLINQERLLEAEFEARTALIEAIGLSGRHSDEAVKLGMALAKIKIAQGQQSEADKLVNAIIRAMDESDLPYNTILMGIACLLKAEILVENLNFDGAMAQYHKAKTIFPENNYILVKNYDRNPYYIISLIMTDRNQEAISKITTAYQIEKKFLGENHYRTATMLGLRAMACVRMGRKQQAFVDFGAAVPILVQNSGYRSTVITRMIIEEYIDFLSEVNGTSMAQNLEIDPLAEAFRFTDSIYKSSVQKALAASGARAALGDPELAELVRKEQDAVQKIQAFETTVTNALASPLDQQNLAAINNLKSDVEALREARAILLKEIKNRFPKYSDFTDPPLTDIATLQQHLNQQEALISIYSGINRTYVWAIPHSGKYYFNSVSLGAKEVNKIVRHLRKALDPAAGTFGDIPPFDLDQAHELFATLLKPVYDGWKNAKDLIIVTPGPLGSLPFSVLPVAPVKPGTGTDILFAGYRKVPWLIRQVSITRQPSVSAFITHRKLPKSDTNRLHFAGFGDPIFNKEQLDSAEANQISQKISPENQGKSIHLRGIRISESGNLDREELTTAQIDSLNRLPDTSEEIESIAAALGADPKQDIFLGKRASERQVKTMDLSDRTIIAFATHALVPGDLDGLYQPALALSAPAVTGDNEDGLLTLEEILRLKLNAHWVVLSACNTGAAQGAGAESVSGLGRAFFYAGTRAILVSMWPVETTSARKLTTALFQYQRENNKLSRAAAFRKSMLDLINSPGYIDNHSGKIVASYAHPLFWAPFIIVGDNGGRVE